MPTRARWRGASWSAAAAVGLLLAAIPGAAAAQDLVLGANLGAHVACHGTTTHPCVFLRAGAYLGLEVDRFDLSAHFAHVAGLNRGRSYDLYNYWGALDVRLAPHLWAVLGAGTRRTRLWTKEGSDWSGGLLGVLGASFRADLADGKPVRFRADLLLEASDYEDGLDVLPSNTLRVEPSHPGGSGTASRSTDAGGARVLIRRGSARTSREHRLSAGRTLHGQRLESRSSPRRLYATLPAFLTALAYILPAPGPRRRPPAPRRPGARPPGPPPPASPGGVLHGPEGARHTTEIPRARSAARSASGQSACPSEPHSVTRAGRHRT